MNLGNYIRAGNTLFGNYGTTRSYITPQQRRYRDIWREYQDSYAPTGLNAASITLDEATISFKTLAEICDEITGTQKCESFIMPTKADLMEFLQKGNKINDDDRLGAS